MIQYFSNKINNKKGFTLVELIVVIGILGILAALAVPKFSKSRGDAAVAAHNANVRTLESAATLAVSDGQVSKKWEKASKTDWEKYLQDWPELPSGLAKKDGTAVTGEYEVEIKANGEIIVTPARIE